MPLITAIEKQRRRPYADVHLEGAYALSLRLDSVAIAGLFVGLELDEARRREVEAEDQRLGAIEVSLKMVALGPRSERDLRDRLRRKGFRRAAVDHAVERMQALGYLDDKAYAKLYVESRLAATPRSRRALSFELARKGVDREVAAAAVEDLSDDNAAYAAAHRRLSAFASLDRQTFRRRLATFLASRGFSYGVARTTIERCWQEMDDNVESDIEDSAL